MKAINGYLENGQFTPLDMISLPRRVQAVLVYNEVVSDEDREARLSWLQSFLSLLKDTADEELPDFPRVHFNRELVDLSDEG